MWKSNSSNSAGKLWVAGIGPGGKDQITLRAGQVLKEADVVLGYQRYLGHLEDMGLDMGREFVPFKMGEEIQRSRIAVDLAAAGKKVAVVSSGDPGIYGMAGPVLEVLGNREIEVEIVPGVTAATAAAAVLGAPLNHDFAVISLSDLLTPWMVIEKRLQAAASADFVLVLYNPQSEKRREQLPAALRILLQYRPETTPVGIVRCIGQLEEEAVITTLGELLSHYLPEIDMRCTVIVGNTETRVINGRLVTPRGYRI